MSNQNKVVVAMSGGVDSSIAAALLVENGYQVIGVSLCLGTDNSITPDSKNNEPDAISSARKSAMQLGIPFFTMDADVIFRRQIIQEFIESCIKGITPNPCIRCNKVIKWGIIMKMARSFSAYFMATGHYARLHRTKANKFELLRSKDKKKDQSYMLCNLTQEQLTHTLFPIGELYKEDVRRIAHRYRLSVADRKDSQDLCFIPDNGFRKYLIEHAPSKIKPGLIFNLQGKQIGTHRGLAFYTIGQRKGLGISASKPFYVISKNIKDNSLIVGTNEELGQSELIAVDVNWISGKAPADCFRAQVKIRYKGVLAWAAITSLDHNRVRVVFNHPLRDITPGQIAVFYVGDVVLGGGVIQ